MKNSAVAVGRISNLAVKRIFECSASCVSRIGCVSRIICAILTFTYESHFVKPMSMECGSFSLLSNRHLWPVSAIAIFSRFIGEFLREGRGVGNDFVGMGREWGVKFRNGKGKKREASRRERSHLQPWLRDGTSKALDFDDSPVKWKLVSYNLKNWPGYFIWTLGVTCGHLSIISIMSKISRLWRIWGLWRNLKISKEKV